MTHATEPTAPRYLTIADLQARFQLGKSAITALIRTGEIRSVKIGAARRIPIDAVEEFERSLESQEGNA